MTEQSMGAKEKEHMEKDGEVEPSAPNGNGESNMAALPIDRGWAWVVLAASSLSMFLAVGWFKCFGIFFVELQRRFRSGSSATSVISSLQNISFSVTALCVMTLGRSLSSRASVAIGSVMVSVSFLLTAFARNLAVVYVTHGVMLGSFFAFIQPQIITMLSTYFDRYRGLANNVAAAFVSVGALVLAPVYTTLFKHFGFTGTYMLVGGGMLNIVITATLLRPTEFYKKKSLRQKNVRDGFEDDHHLENGLVGTKLLPERTSTQDMSGSIASLASIGLHHSGIVPNSVTDLRLPETGNTNKTDTSIKNGITDKDLSRTSKITNALKQLSAQLCGTGLLGKRVFLYYLLCNVFLISGCVVCESYIAAHAVDNGLDSERVALLISALAVADLCFKAPVAVLSDRKWIRRSTIMAAAAVILGIASFFVFLLRTFWSLFVYSVILGMLQPVYFSLYPVVAIDLLSLEELKAALGFLAMIQGGAVGCCMPLAGYLRDVTGRYDATFWLGGGLLTLGGVLCYLLPVIKARSDLNREKVDAIANKKLVDLGTDEDNFIE